MLPTSKGSGFRAFPSAQTSLVPFRTLARALLRRPGDYEPMGRLCICVLVYLFICVFVCVSVCACVSLTSYVCFFVSLCRFINVCLYVSKCLCVCVIVGGVYVCVTVCLRMHLCICLCPCTVVRASLGVTLRVRGLPVYVYTPVISSDQWYPVELSLVVVVVHPTKHHHTALLLISVERSEGVILGRQ